MNADRVSRVLANRFEGLTPTPATKHLSQDAKGERQEHPRPVHLVGHHVANLLPVLAAIHPVEDGRAQYQRHQNLQYYAAYLHSGSKGTNYF